MKKTTFLLILFTSLAVLNLSYAKGTKITARSKEVIALVKKAKDYIAKNGQEKAITEFNKKSGEFSKNSSYIFALDYHRTFLATINYPNLVGTNQFNLKDPTEVF